MIEAAGNLLKQVEGINRCVWNLGPHAPGSLEPLPATLTRERLDLLREADHLVMDGLHRHGVYDEIWQCPTVLVPLQIDGRGEELCVIRPVRSERAMTAAAAPLPAALLDELRASILALPGISGLALDLTSKPPGTIEWE
jgi:GMP synthase (glutamine-hydrolysing)